MDARYSKKMVKLVIPGDEINMVSGPEVIQNALRPLFKNATRGVRDPVQKLRIDKMVDKNLEEAYGKIITTGEQAVFENVHIEKAMDTRDILMGYGVFGFSFMQMDDKTGRLKVLAADELEELVKL